jgi:hypothetical protein
MSSMEHLKRFRQALQNEQYDTKILEITEESLLPCLILYLGKDGDQRDRILKIFVQEQEIGEALFPEDKEPKSIILSILFELEFPFSFDPYYTAQLASLLHFLNDQHKVTGFGMDEANQKIFFRFHTISTEKGIDVKVLLSIIGIIMLYYDIHYQSIEEVAKGRITFDELAQKIIENSKELPKFE